MESELHAFILWENAVPKSEQIIDNIKEKFEICKIYKIEWPKSKFADNLKRFYGVTLANPIQKESICGNGPFLLVIVLDKNPKHGKRKTSLGSQIVNTNIYDQKMEYRKKLGSGYIIHSSINEKEANHDFTLLLGKNVKQLKTELEDFCYKNIEEKQMDLFGSNWNHPDELFFVLNSIVDYVVLRNFEQFPNELINEDHKDIDLLTSERWQLPYILNMKKKYTENVGFIPFLEIGGKKIKLDIRYVGDRYYDEKWSKDILKRRVLSKNGVYVPCNEDHFFSLLYHMLIHKKKLSNDYCKKLYKIAPKYIIENHKNNEFKKFSTLKKILEEFMKKNGYKYTDSVSYRLNHNEFFRLLNVGVFTIKHEGWRFLLRATKSKIRKGVKI